MTKLILFAFDGVITNQESGSYSICHYISKKNYIPIYDAINCYAPYESKLNKGDLKHIEFWDEFCQCVNLEIDVKIIEDAIRATPFVDEMLEFVSELRKKRKIVLISLNSVERMNLLKEKLETKFDKIVNSFEFRKDQIDMELIQNAVDSFNFEPSECLYIDYNTKNVETAKKVGLKTITFDTRDANLKHEIEKIKNQT